MPILEILKSYAFPLPNFSDKVENDTYIQSELWMKFNTHDPKKTIHVFSEGVTDEIFYRKFIEKYYSNYKIKFWVCGTRSNVEEMLWLIKDNSRNWRDNNVKYNRSKLLFLLDRDYYLSKKINEKFRKDKLKSDITDNYENIFITDLHSMENYLVGKHTFRLLMEQVFCIVDIANLKELEKQFEEQYEKFLDFYLYCYLWLNIILNGKPRNILDSIYKKSLMINKDLEVKTALHIMTDDKLDFDKIGNLLLECLKPHEIQKIKNIDYNTFKSNLENEYKIKKEMSLEEKKKFVRGKDDIWFFIWFYKSLRDSFLDSSKKELNDLKLKEKSEKNINITYASDINLNKNNALYILTYKLQIPETIKTFLVFNSNNWEQYMNNQGINNE